MSTPDLKAFADKHVNDLFDVLALLDAAGARIEAAAPSTGADPHGAEETHHTARLICMASGKVKVISDLLFAAQG